MMKKCPACPVDQQQRKLCSKLLSSFVSAVGYSSCWKMSKRTNEPIRLIFPASTVAYLPVRLFFR